MSFYKIQENTFLAKETMKDIFSNLLKQPKRAETQQNNNVYV